MKKTIGVMGRASGDFSDELIEKARVIGEEIAKNNFILVTGATTGMSFESTKGAKHENGMVIGISPWINKDEHLAKNYPIENFDFILYTGYGHKGRNILNIRACDAVIIINGSIGTLNEFTIAYDDGKVIGVLESGGISEKIKEIIQVCNKKTNAIVIYDSDPKMLIEKIIKLI
ncbi:MAG: hypothetical protein ABIG89_04375 [Candidatus Woesearchaeota archaeon]